MCEVLRCRLSTLAANQDDKEAKRVEEQKVIGEKMKAREKSTPAVLDTPRVMVDTLYGVSDTPRTALDTPRAVIDTHMMCQTRFVVGWTHPVPS